MIGSGIWVMRHMAEAQQQTFATFTGHLMKTTDVIDVVPPEDSRIIDVMVEEGAEVQAGQPLAKSVREGIEEKRQALLDEATELVAEVKCLRSDLAVNKPSPIDGPQGTPSRAEINETIGHQRCALDRERLSVALSESWSKTTLLEERLALLDRYWHVARRATHRADGEQNQAVEALQKALKIALARNLVRDDLSAEKARARTIALEVKAARVARLEAARQQLDETLGEIEAIDEMRKEVIIRAPRTGTIRNRRTGLKGKTIPKDTAIMRVVYGEGNLRVRVQLDRKTYEDLTTGHTTNLRIAALPPQTPILQGEIQRRFVEKQGIKTAYVAEIALNDAAEQAFSKQFKHGLEPGVWSDVEIEIGDQTPFGLAASLFSRQGTFCQDISQSLPFACEAD